MKTTRVWIESSILLALGACGQPREFIMGESHRGSQEFQTMLRLSSNANSPAPMQEGSGLNLNFDQSKIVQITQDPASSTWRWLSFDRDRQEKIPKNESILTWSQKFIAENSRNLGLEPAELSSFDNTLYDPFPNQTYVTFTRQFQGIPVQSAFVQLIFSHDDTGWVLREVLNNSYGPIKLDSSSPSPISTEEAIASTGLNDLEFLSKRQIIQPKLGPDGIYEFRQATQFTL
ncbi:MAG: hypothetical protein NTX25_02475, partial [Proteobacteria bacterium]|nr:hypothetical protein [Pseudomonadota bacterium]